MRSSPGASAFSIAASPSSHPASVIRHPDPECWKPQATLPGNATASALRPLTLMKSRKRARAASSGTPNSSQRRTWSASVGSRHGLTATNRTKPGRLARGLPHRGVALERRKGRFQVFVRHHTKHVIGRLVTHLHPGIDVVAALDLPFVDVRRVTESLEFLGDPVRPFTVGTRVGDEIIGHGPIKTRGAGGSKGCRAARWAGAGDWNRAGNDEERLRRRSCRNIESRPPYSL